MLALGCPACGWECSTDYEGAQTVYCRCGSVMVDQEAWVPPGFSEEAKRFLEHPDGVECVLKGIEP